MPLLSGISRYVNRIGMLSSNAKLYLIATILRGFSFGIWGVIFYLYLNLDAIGFQPDFIGNMFTAGALATGLMAMPAGIFYERIGPKRALLIGSTANFISLIQIITLESAILLFASILSSLISTLGWVASSPFMMENSRQEERTYLFSLNWSLMITMSVVGSFVGGILPNLFNSFLISPIGAEGHAVGYRLSLLTSIALALAAAIPILMIKEKRRRQKQNIVDLLNLRNIQSRWTIIKFMIPTALIGFGAGFIVPLFNLFFKLKFSATTEQIGIISALSSVTLAIGTLAAPMLSGKLGKVRSIVLCQYLSTPFIMLITLSPNIGLASTAYITRTALMNMAGPINSTLQMESVTEGERGVTNGLMVTADNIPRAITASISGKMMTGNDFYTPFLFTTMTYIIASSLYFIFFRRVEAQTNTQKSLGAES